jgi:hypothetical protein
METDRERIDRNVLELLTELRVALPGVQVLFAFLLIVPFNERYSDVTPFQEKVYFATLLCTAAATTFLIAPSVHHRIQFRDQDKERIVLVANKLFIAGLGFLAIAIVGVVMLVTDFLFDPAATVAVATATAALVLVVWFAIPIRRKLTR